MHPVPKAISTRHTDDVFFEELLAIEILAERPDRWGVPQVLPDFQPIPSCWVRPRRLPRRVSGHLHLEREFLICFTPPRPRCGLGRCDGALQNLGRGGGCGRGQRNPTLITPAAQSAPRPQSVFHPSWLLPRCRPSIFRFGFVHRAIKIHSRVCQERIPVDNTGGRPNHACGWFSVTICP